MKLKFKNIKFTHIILGLFLIASVVGFASPIFAIDLGGYNAGQMLTIGDSGNHYAVADSNYLLGGHMQVPDRCALLGNPTVITIGAATTTTTYIEATRRRLGMFVTVVNDTSTTTCVSGSTTGTGVALTTYILVSNRSATGTAITDNSLDGKISAAATTTDANWQVFGGAGGISGLTSVIYNSAATNSNGGAASGSSLVLYPADSSNPGLVSTSSQTFAGAKSFAQKAVFNNSADFSTLGTSAPGGFGITYALGTPGTLSNDLQFRWDPTQHFLTLGGGSIAKSIIGIQTINLNEDSSNDNSIISVPNTAAIVGNSSAPGAILGINFSPTMTAAGNSQDLVGLNVSPSYGTSGFFAGANVYDAIFNGGGNVGIGTSSPNGIFEVAQQSAPSAGFGLVTIRAGFSTVSGANTHFLNSFKPGDTITIAQTSSTTISASVVSVTDNTNLVVDSPWGVSLSNKAYYTNGGSRFIVKGNGDVGIGMVDRTVPSQKLMVYGTPLDNDSVYSSTQVQQYTGLTSIGSNYGNPGDTDVFLGDIHGTELAISSDDTFAGNLIDMQKAGSSMFSVTNSGLTTTQNIIDSGIDGNSVVFVNGTHTLVGDASNFSYKPTGYFNLGFSGNSNISLDAVNGNYKFGDMSGTSNAPGYLSVSGTGLVSGIPVWNASIKDSVVGQGRTYLSIDRGVVCASLTCRQTGHYVFGDQSGASSTGLSLDLRDLGSGGTTRYAEIGDVIGIGNRNILKLDDYNSTFSYSSSGSPVLSVDATGHITDGRYAASLVYGDVSGVLNAIPLSSATNTTLHGGLVPSFSVLSLTTDATGTLPIALGGTNATTTGATGTVAYSNGTGYAFTSTSSHSGQALVSGDGTTAPQWFVPTQGAVLFAGASGALSADASHFSWDATNTRFGLGTSAPVSLFNVSGTPTATRTSALISVGDGGFAGTTTSFSGFSATGTVFAINTATSFTGSLFDLQVGGAYKFKVDASGNLMTKNNFGAGCDGGFTACDLVFTASTTHPVFSVGDLVNGGNRTKFILDDTIGQVTIKNSQFNVTATSGQNFLSINTASSGVISLGDIGGMYGNAYLAMSGRETSIGDGMGTPYFDVNPTTGNYILGTLFSGTGNGTTLLLNDSTTNSTISAKSAGIFADNGFSVSDVSGTKPSLVDNTLFGSYRLGDTSGLIGNGTYLNIDDTNRLVSFSGTHLSSVVDSGVNYVPVALSSNRMFRSGSFTGTSNTAYTITITDARLPVTYSSSTGSFATSEHVVMSSCAASGTHGLISSLFGGSGLFLSSLVYVGSTNLFGCVVTDTDSGVSATISGGGLYSGIYIWTDGVTTATGTLSTSTRLLSNGISLTWNDGAGFVPGISMGDTFSFSYSFQGKMLALDGINHLYKMGDVDNSYGGSVLTIGATTTTLNNLSLFNILGTPTATSSYGLLSLGDGGFSGASSTRFAGSATGTEFGINVTSSFGGDLLDIQKGGTPKLKLDSFGNLSLNSTSTSIASLFVRSSTSTTDIFQLQNATSSVVFDVSALGVIKSYDGTGANNLFKIDPANNVYAMGDIGGTQNNGTAISINDSTGVQSISLKGTAFATSTTGLVAIGNGNFTGTSTGKFSGSALGTQLAMNTTSTFAGDLVDLQVGGVPKFVVDASGDLAIGGNFYSKGLSWKNQTAIATSTWQGVAYGNGLFVAVASTGSTSTDIMTSPDGTNWTSTHSPVARRWDSVTYGNGLFVSVANDSATNTIMTSPDGVIWTSRVSPSSSTWKKVAYGNGMFVAVSFDGSIMSSPDGTTWTNQTSPSSRQWDGLTYGNGLFVAVSYDGSTSTDIMTSPDGVIWTSRVSPEALNWTSVTYGNGTFVAVASSSTDIMTSPNAITWTTHVTSLSSLWNDVVYADGLFVAVGASTSSSPYIMTSPDVVTWTSRVSPSAVSWNGIAYGNGVFVAVGNGGTIGGDVMTSGSADNTSVQNNNIYQGGIAVQNGITVHGNDNFWGTPVATSTYGLVSIGDGGFVGGGNNFNGSASGTILAMNASSTFAGDLLNFEVASSSVFKINQTSLAFGNGANNFLSIDSNAKLYGLGDLNSIASGTRFTLNDTSASSSALLVANNNFTINDTSGNNYFLADTQNQKYQLGDIGQKVIGGIAGNGTYLSIDDAHSMTKFYGASTNATSTSVSYTPVGIPQNNLIFGGTFTGATSTPTTYTVTLTSNSVFYGYTASSSGFSGGDPVVINNIGTGTTTGLFSSFVTYAGSSTVLLNNVVQSSTFGTILTDTITGATTTLDGTMPSLGPNTYSWTDGTNSGSGVPVYATSTLSNGVTVHFSSPFLSYSYGDMWSWTYYPQNSVMLALDGLNHSYSLGDVDNTYNGPLFTMGSNSTSLGDVNGSYNGPLFTVGLNSTQLVSSSGANLSIDSTGSLSSSMLTNHTGAYLATGSSTELSVLDGSYEGSATGTITIAVDGVFVSGMSVPSDGTYSFDAYSDSTSTTGHCVLASPSVGNGFFRYSSAGGALTGWHIFPGETLYRRPPVASHTNPCDNSWDGGTIVFPVSTSAFNDTYGISGVLGGSQDHDTMYSAYARPGTYAFGPEIKFNSVYQHDFGETWTIVVGGTGAAHSSFNLSSDGNDVFNITAGGTINSYDVTGANNYFSISPTTHYFGMGDLSGTGANFKITGTTTGLFQINHSNVSITSGSLTVTSLGGASCVINGSSATGTAITSGGAVYCSSDERLKTNIAELASSTLDKINALRPVTFNWNSDPNGDQSIGFIAQDMQKVFPEFVNIVDPNTGYLGVNYAGLVSPIVKAIQEMDLKLEPLTSLDPSQDGSLASLIKKYLADAMNGIDSIFANKVQTKELCLDDVCVTKTQLQQMLNQANVQSAIIGPVIGIDTGTSTIETSSSTTVIISTGTSTGDGSSTSTDMGTATSTIETSTSTIDATTTTVTTVLAAPSIPITSTTTIDSSSAGSSTSGSDSIATTTTPIDVLTSTSSASIDSTTTTP